MNTLIDILNNEKIKYRTINKGKEDELIQINKINLTHWLKRIIKKQNLKFTPIDSKVLIYKK